MNNVTILYVTTPSLAEAKDLAGILVSARAAACVNILPQMHSVYEWDGKIETAEETVMLVKTTKACAAAARNLIARRHSYDTPCILALPICENGSSVDYVHWINGQTGSAPH